MVVSKLSPGQMQSTQPTVTAASSTISLQSSTLSNHIRHVQSVVASVDDLIEGITTVPASKQITVKRVGWMIRGKRIMKMRDKVASVKLNISVLLISKTLYVTTSPKYKFCPWRCMTDACSFRYQLSSLDSRIARLEAMSTPRHQEVMHDITPAMFTRENTNSRVRGRNPRYFARVTTRDARSEWHINGLGMKSTGGISDTQPYN